MVRKLPAYMTKILFGKGVKWNKQKYAPAIYDKQIRSVIKESCDLPGQYGHKKYVHTVWNQHPISSLFYLMNWKYEND
jgi:hypothetical protein